MRVIATFLPEQQPASPDAAAREDSDRHLTKTISQVPLEKLFACMVAPLPATADPAFTPLLRHTLPLIMT